MEPSTAPFNGETLQNGRKEAAVKFKVTENDGVVIFSPAGRMTAGPDLDKLREKIRELVRVGSRRMVIDLGRVPWAGSPGLGLLIETKKLLGSVQGDLRLARITEKIEDVIDITHLAREFKSCSSVRQAVQDLLAVN